MEFSKKDIVVSFCRKPRGHLHRLMKETQILYLVIKYDKRCRSVLMCTHRLYTLIDLKFVVSDFTYVS